MVCGGRQDVVAVIATALVEVKERIADAGRIRSIWTGLGIQSPPPQNSDCRYVTAYQYLCVA
jgi:hypothetical protein